MPFKYSEPIERIQANSVISETSAHNGVACWEWIGSRKYNRSGVAYGTISRRITKGKDKGKVQKMLAHRFVVQFVLGRKLSARQVVMHLCNNTLCVHPDHLKGGTQRQNMRQMVRDGRHKNGSTA
jgi:L-amino acid N-acyltransferase YncA